MPVNRKLAARRTLTKRQIRELRKVVDAKGGVSATAKEAGIGREPLTRALAGEALRGGTLVAVEALLANADLETEVVAAGLVDESLRKGSR